MNTIIIDIRDDTSYTTGHLPGAIHISATNLYLHPEKYLNHDTKYSFYCHSGHQSKLLVTYLNMLGYHCVNIDGGYFKNLLQ